MDMKTAARLSIQADDLDDELRQFLIAKLAAAEGLAVEMEKIERVANAHLDNPIGVAQEYINVTVTLRQIAHNALRQYRETE